MIIKFAVLIGNSDHKEVTDRCDYYCSVKWTRLDDQNPLLSSNKNDDDDKLFIRLQIPALDFISAKFYFIYLISYMQMLAKTIWNIEIFDTLPDTLLLFWKCMCVWLCTYTHTHTHTFLSQLNVMKSF